jgi:hypothetical protein
MRTKGKKDGTRMPEWKNRMARIKNLSLQYCGCCHESLAKPGDSEQLHPPVHSFDKQAASCDRIAATATGQQESRLRIFLESGMSNALLRYQFLNCRRGDRAYEGAAFDSVRDIKVRPESGCQIMDEAKSGVRECHARHQGGIGHPCP